MYAPIRGARIVVVDDKSVRADMSASWLAQMAWDVFVLDGADAGSFSEAGPSKRSLPVLPANQKVSPQTLAAWLKESADIVVIDLSKHAQFCKSHIPGAWFLIRSLMDQSLPNIPKARRYVLTCPDASLAQFAAHDLSTKIHDEIFVLDGGNQAWDKAGLEMVSGDENLASSPIDRYRRPYEGTNVPDAAMQAYLDWEFGLIEQLARDATHHFNPMKFNAPR